MRILAVADLHYSLPQYDWLTAIAGRFDVVIVAGDHLDTSSLVDPQAQRVVIQKYVGRLREATQLIICSGNHDLDSRDASGERVAKWIADIGADGVPADGNSLVVDDTLFTICPWWDGTTAREEIATLLASDAPRRTRRWIWVHHAPPGHSPTSWGGSRYFGDVELERWIAAYGPEMVFSGHVHQSPFVKDGSWVDRIGPTWVFNAGHQFGAPPAHVIVDTAADMAYWFSAAGNERIELDQPLTRPVAKLTAPPEWLIREERESQAPGAAERPEAAAPQT